MPALVVSFPDELSEREALIMCNRNRPKTNEQIGRELAVIRDVEEERARLRMLAAQNNKSAGDARAAVERVPPLTEETGKARDIAAAKVGISGKTAEKGAEILEAVEILKEEGKTDPAPVSPLPCPASIPANP